MGSYSLFIRSGRVLILQNTIGCIEDQKQGLIVLTQESTARAIFTERSLRPKALLTDPSFAEAY